MMKLSKKNNAIKCAYKKGYRVTNGNVTYKNKQVSCRLDSHGYNSFSLRDENSKCITIRVHRMVAYQKFGNKIFRTYPF